MTEQFRDPYEVRIGIPTVSWKYARVGFGIRGIVLPQDDGSAYRLSQQVSIQGDPLWWVRQDGGKDPRVQQDFLLGFVQDIKTGQPVGDDEWLSTKATERFNNAKASGDPDALALIELVQKFKLRRQIIKGESLEKGMLAAVRALSAEFGPKPVIAAGIELVLTELKPNEHQGETKIFTVKYTAPTDATRAKVQEYLAARPKKDDPYEGRPSGSLTHEPPSAPAGDDEDPPF